MPTIAKLSDIVTPEELRAMLGTSVKEFADGLVDLPVYKRTVKIACDRADSRIWQIYAALPSDAATFNDDQTNFSELFITFVAWSTARAIAIALPQSSPQEIGNGNAVMHRNDDAAESVIANIDQQIRDIVPLLVNAAEVLQPAAAKQVNVAYTFGRFGASGDPVTG
jgi:hypothetical protein